MKRICLLVLVLGIGSVSALRAFPPEPDKPSSLPRVDDPRLVLAVFMRQKLQASSRILEGLATEDMELVAAGAREMNRMSTAEKWRVSNSALYRQFSEDFQRNTADLIKAAEDKNLDKSALKWIAATMNCIDCHRFVRNDLITEEGRSR